MVRRVTVVIGLCVALAACGRGAGGAGAETAKPPTGNKVSLGLHLAAGQKFDVAIESKQKVTQTIEGKPLETEQTLSTARTYEVESVSPAGVARVKATYTAFKMKQSGPGGLDIDTTRSSGGTALETEFRSLVGRPVTMEIDAQGRLRRPAPTSTRASSAPATGAAILSATAPATAAASAPAAGTQAAIVTATQEAQGMLEGQSAAEFEQLLGLYPDKPVDNGDSWTRPVSTPGAFAIEGQQTYTLLEHDASKAVLGVAGTLASAATASAPAGALSVRPEYSGKSSGRIVLDLAMGMPESMHTHETFSGKIAGAGSGVPAGKSWAIELTSESTVTVTRR